MQTEAKNGELDRVSGAVQPMNVATAAPADNAVKYLSTGAIAGCYRST